MRSTPLLALGGLVLMAAAAHAQAQPANGPPAADQKFATTAAAAGLSEVAEAQIAVTKSNRQDVKDFAQQMIHDHTQANQQLQQVASSEGVTLPAQPGPADTAAADKLSALSGHAFDRAYIRDQRKAHHQAVRLFKHESRRGKDPALKQFAAATLPTLEHHLQMVEALPMKPRQQ